MAEKRATRSLSEVTEVQQIVSPVPVSDSVGNQITPAKEDTLGQVKTKTDNLDVALSTRASESTLSSVNGKLPSALTGSGNLKTAVQEALPSGINNIGDVDIVSNVNAPNRSSWKTLSQNVTTAGTPVQLSSNSVANGFAVVVKAKDTNTGKIKVGESNTTLNVTLKAEQSIRIFVNNSNLIWIDSTVSGEGVEVFFET